MGWIVDFFGALQAPIQPIPQVQAVGAFQNLGVENGFSNNQVQQYFMPQLIEQPKTEK